MHASVQEQYQVLMKNCQSGFRLKYCSGTCAESTGCTQGMINASYSKSFVCRLSHQSAYSNPITGNVDGWDYITMNQPLSRQIYVHQYKYDYISRKPSNSNKKTSIIKSVLVCYVSTYACCGIIRMLAIHMFVLYCIDNKDVAMKVL